MIKLDSIKQYFANLRQTSPHHLMIPIVIALIGGLILIKKKFG